MPLRKVCVKCGRSGLAFTFSSYGLCGRCDYERQIREQKERKEEKQPTIVETREHGFAAADMPKVPLPCVKMDKVQVTPSSAEMLRKSFIAIDIETTGLNSAYDRIIEIGAVLFIDGEVKKVFHH